MKLIAFDLSTRVACAALYVDGQCAATRNWEETRSGGQRLFGHIREMTEEAHCSLTELDAWVTGRGPGNYSGLRTALIVAQTMALPDKTPVYTISSGEILAAQIAREYPGDSHIAVVGDARRKRLWYGMFHQQHNQLVLEGDWTLKPVDELMQQWPEGTRAVSSDWSRIANAIQPAWRDDIQWITEDRFPSAQVLAERVEEKLQTKIPTEPLSPIYIHPPVVVR